MMSARLLELGRELAAVVGVLCACLALGLNRATFYRRRVEKPGDGAKPTRVARPPLALNDAEREAVRAVLVEPRFVDCAPRSIVATLLDEGRYLASVATFYRVLREDRACAERRDQLRHPAYSRPELLATTINQVWSWDITKLRGPGKWNYFYLYVVLDIFSRYAVGWMLAPRECGTLARELIEACARREGIVAEQLTVHADRGGPMKSKPLALLLADLGVRRSHSRPYTSDDNPYSEAQFKTLKYRSDFPERFASIEEARAYCAQFFDWYNHEHRHGGIAFVTPHAMHRGLAPAIIAARALTLKDAFERHPERFKGKLPHPPALPTRAGINWPAPEPCT